MHDKRAEAEKSGRRAERWAALYLQLKGYRVLQRRLKGPMGEIDLVARRGQTLVFAEVKQRTDTVSALEAVTRAQQIRITRMAQIYLAEQADHDRLTIRFDILALTNAPWLRQLWHIKHVENAWMADQG